MTEPLTAEELAELRAIFAVDRSEFALFGDMRPGQLRALFATIDAKDAELATLRTRLAAYEEALREAEPQVRNSMSHPHNNDDWFGRGKRWLAKWRVLSGEPEAGP